MEKMVAKLIKKLKSLRPAGARKAGCNLNFFSLRNTCKYMKLLKKMVTPPPPPSALRHRWF